MKACPPVLSGVVAGGLAIWGVLLSCRTEGRGTVITAGAICLLAEVSGFGMEATLGCCLTAPSGAVGFFSLSAQVPPPEGAELTIPVEAEAEAGADPPAYY